MDAPPLSRYARKQALKRIAFFLPRSERCEIIYTLKGVNYSARIPTPRSNEALHQAMLARGADLAAVRSVRAA